MQSAAYYLHSIFDIQIDILMTLRSDFKGGPDLLTGAVLKNDVLLTSQSLLVNKCILLVKSLWSILNIASH